MADYAIHDTTLESIANTIRKKDGTSALIDPATYAERVNLMGMLEEKTASSASVCSFSDGADDVPMSSVVAHIAPTLTGTNAVNMVQAGKNFYPISVGADRFTNNGGATHSNDNGTLVIVASTGNASGVYINTSDTLCEARNVLKWFYDNEYPKTISFDVVASADNISFRITSGNNTLVTIGTTPTRVSHVSTGNNLSLYAVNNSATIRISNLQIEYGSTATAYEPYTEPTSYTANLGRTVYGADVDLVSGQGSETHTHYTLDNLTWSGGVIGGQMWCWYVDLSADGLKLPLNSEIFGGICDNYSPIRYNGISSNANTIALRNNGYLYVNNGSDTIEPTGKVTIELATPQDFTFDGQEIPSILGVNNLWHEDGETECTYRSSGTVTPVPIQPVLISKTITENGTYYAEDDGADGYSEVSVNVEPVTLNIHEGKLDVSTGTITQDSDYYYTDTFECPNGEILFDCGEQTTSTFVGLELVYSSDNSHANYFSCASRYRQVDISQYYSASKKARLAFKKTNAPITILMDLGNSKIYSTLDGVKFEEETQANLLSMSPAPVSQEESEEEEE